jgi:hypothetical protein
MASAAFLLMLGGFMKPYPESSKAANLSEPGQYQHVHTSGRGSASSLIGLALFLVLAPAALASNTWYVDGAHGNDHNSCKSRQHACKTIGHAISLAFSGDFIIVAPATYPENLTVGMGLTVTGAGAKTTIIDGGGINTVVTISNTNAHVTLSRVTIRNGLGTSANGGGVNNSGTLTINKGVIAGNTSQGSGGGIYNNGRLTINNGVIAGNTAQESGGGVINDGGGMTINETIISRNSTTGDGGGIWNIGTLKINDSTISGNTAGKILFSTGGGIANSATMTINDSTISGNTVVRFGVGGIENLEGTLTISNSTISANRGGINVNLGTATLQNSIVANNSGQNCSNVVTSNGYNLSSDGSCNFNGPGDLNNTNPMLGRLHYNGGPTQTQALLSGSPAIDAGNPGGCTDGHGHLLKTDQRGKPRHDKEDIGGCDMGAYERQTD